MTRTAILYVTERCNQACVFCLEEDGTALRPDVAPERVVADLASLRARGAEHITFMGGETFLRKDLPSLLTESKRLGFTRLGVTTNGTALAHPGFLDRMIAAGLDFVEISVHADDAALAEKISGKGFTFDRQQRALAELATARTRIQVIVNIVVCRQNRDRLTAIAQMLLDDHPQLQPIIKWKFVSMIGAAADESEPPLRYDEIDLGPALALCRERGVDYWLYNFPLCRIPGEAARSHEAQAFVLDWRYHDYDHRRRDGYYDSGFQLEGNVWPAPCDDCGLAAICPGIEETYRLRHGESELRAQLVDVLPSVRTILAGAGREPAESEIIVKALRGRSRPRRFVPEMEPRPGEAAIAFEHPSWDEPLWFELGPIHDGDKKARSFVSGRRLRLSYRKASREPGSDPAGQALLEALSTTLSSLDASTFALPTAAERLAEVAPPGWSRGAVKLGPPVPDASQPLSIRVPAR